MGIPQTPESHRYFHVVSIFKHRQKSLAWGSFPRIPNYDYYYHRGTHVCVVLKGQSVKTGVAMKKVEEKGDRYET